MPDNVLNSEILMLRFQYWFSEKQCRPSRRVVLSAAWSHFFTRLQSLSLKTCKTWSMVLLDGANRRLGSRHGYRRSRESEQRPSSWRCHLISVSYTHLDVYKRQPCTCDSYTCNCILLNSIIFMVQLNLHFSLINENSLGNNFIIVAIFHLAWRERSCQRLGTVLCSQYLPEEWAKTFRIRLLPCHGVVGKSLACYTARLPFVSRCR